MSEALKNRPRIAAVLLAAGASRRFGEGNKLLADVGGVPLVRRVAQALAQSMVAEIIVVTGPDADRVRAALSDLRVSFVHNLGHASGMGGSVATGIRAVATDMVGAFVCPGDMPSLDAGLIDRLIREFVVADGDGIIVPVLADGSQRNPVLWPRRHFARLTSLTGEGGAKPVLAEHAQECRFVETGNDDAFDDIDTAEDLARHCRSRHS